MPCTVPPSHKVNLWQLHSTIFVDLQSKSLLFHNLCRCMVCQHMPGRGHPMNCWGPASLDRRLVPGAFSGASVLRSHAAFSVACVTYLKPIATTRLTGPRPKNYDFKPRVVGGSRSPLCYWAYSRRWTIAITLSDAAYLDLMMYLPDGRVIATLGAVSPTNVHVSISV